MNSSSIDIFMIVFSTLAALAILYCLYKIFEAIIEYWIDRRILDQRVFTSYEKEGLYRTIERMQKAIDALEKKKK